MKKLTSLLHVLLFSCIAATPGLAQIFNPPSATTCEYSYPAAGSPDIGLTDHTSAYSFEPVNTAIGSGTLFLSGWDEATAGSPAGVSWSLAPMGNPCAPTVQGIIPYTNVRDLEVGYLMAGGDPEIVVAYHLTGIGHMVDIYSLNTGTPVLLYTNVLSAMTNYTRISIDCHLEYAAAITWQDARGINAVVINNTFPLTFSGIVTLAGTRGETTVDCAFSHATGLDVQCVYYNPVTGNITESQFDYWATLPLPTGTTIVPTVNDVNPVGACKPGGGNPENPPHPINQCVYMNIDCPGHDMQDNWAYTYTIDNMNISVRVMDFVFNPTTAFTRVVNDASILPARPINWDINMHPFCTYDGTWQCGGRGIMTGWYTRATDPATGAPAGYIAVKTNTSVTAMLSSIDYLTIANNPTWASNTPVLSMSKQDDRVNFLYTIFPEFNPMMGAYQMQNKFPPLCGASYKQPGGIEHTCSDAPKLVTFQQEHKAATSITAYPNPFDNFFTITIPAALQQSEATITVTNLMGVVSGSYSGTLGKANVYLSSLSKTLATGTYVMHVNIAGQPKQTIKLVKMN